MPRYFIDLHDGSQPVRDEVGFELPDLPAARAKVTRIMSVIARDLQPDLDRQDYVACVRDPLGTVVYRARLSLVAEALTEADAQGDRAKPLPAASRRDGRRAERAHRDQGPIGRRAKRKPELADAGACD